MATTARDSAPATRRAGPVWSRPSSTCSGASTPKTLWRSNAGRVIGRRIVREQVGGEQTAREVEERICPDPALSFAVPDQHPRLADGAVAQALGRAARRWTTFPTPSWTAWPSMGFDWVWFLSVWQTGPAAQAISRANPGVAPRVRRKRCRTSRKKTSPAPGSPSRTTPCIAIWAATRRSHACDSGCSNAD